MRQLLNTYKVYRKRYLIQRESIDVTNYTSREMNSIISFIDSQKNLVWEYLKIDKNV